MQNFNKLISDNEFECPITKEQFFKVIILPDGFSYEKWAIKKWILKKKVSPMTGLTLYNYQLRKNFHLQYLTNSFHSKKRRFSFLQLINKSQKSSVVISEIDLQEEKSIFHQKKLICQNYNRSKLSKPEFDSKITQLYTAHPNNESINQTYIVNRFADFQLQQAKAAIQNLRLFKPLSMITYYSKIELQYLQKKSLKASKAFQKALDLKPFQEYTISEIKSLIHSSCQIDNFEISKYFCKLCVNAFPSEYWFWSWLICNYCNVKKYEKVINLSDTYLSKFGMDSALMSNRSTAFYYLNRVEQALQSYTYEIDNLQNSQFYAEAWLGRGILKFENQLQGWEEDLIQASKLDDKFILGADEILMQIYYKQHSYSKANQIAIDLKARIGSYDKIEIGSLLLIARIKAKSNLIEEAVEIYLVLAQKDPDNNDIYQEEINSLFVNENST